MPSSTSSQTFFAWTFMAYSSGRLYSHTAKLHLSTTTLSRLAIKANGADGDRGFSFNLRNPNNMAEGERESLVYTGWQQSSCTHGIKTLLPSLSCRTNSKARHLLLRPLRRPRRSLSSSYHRRQHRPRAKPPTPPYSLSPADP